MHIMIVFALRHLCLAGLVLALLLPQARAESFEDWLADFRDEALAAGIDPAMIDANLDGLSPDPRIIELDGRQTETVLTLAQYLDRVVPQSRVDAGRTRLAQHHALLERISTQYGVRAPVIVALWGIESDFGRFTGGFDVIRSLATLAHEGRRRSLFTENLIAALKILEAGHIDRAAMTGSFAGAMGQCQFMPRSFLRLAVDGDGDGRADIWTNHADIFASIANYLDRAGWQTGARWGRAVRLPAGGLDPSLLGRDKKQPLAAWQALGVRQPDGSDLPVSIMEGGIIQPDGPGTAAYLVYANFDVFMDWNRSQKFALAVGQLSDRIAGR